eukprot:COSAG06_NODE_1375_length_9650_cov_58.233902_8_plen_91_part_00
MNALDFVTTASPEVPSRSGPARQKTPRKMQVPCIEFMSSAPSCPGQLMSMTHVSADSGAMYEYMCWWSVSENTLGVPYDVRSDSVTAEAS